MALDWLKSGLLARRNYGKAIEQLQVQLKKRRGDPRLQLQLAEVFIQANRKKDALPLLEAVADEFALEGFAARAIAILKRIRSIDPENTQAEEKLAYLIAQQDNPAPSPWRERTLAAPRLEFGMEEIGDDVIGMEAFDPNDMAAAAPAAEPDEEWEAPEVPGDAPTEVPADLDLPPATPTAESASVEAPIAPPQKAAAPKRPPVAAAAAPFGLDLNDESVRHEFLTLIDMAFAPAPEASAGAAGADVAPSVAASPLFSDFRPDELLAVMRGLELKRFEPGEIVVSQGEHGSSLFIVASGKARAYLKGRTGRNVLVRSLGEGDFFGEIALMTGLPRTATVTAETRCELLELERAQYDDIAKAHPRVREVLQEFYSKRANTSVDEATKKLGTEPAE